MSKSTEAGGIKNQKRTREGKGATRVEASATKTKVDIIKLETIINLDYPEVYEKLTTKELRALGKVKWLDTTEPYLTTILADVMMAIQDNMDLEIILEAESYDAFYFSMPQMIKWDEGHQKAVEEELTSGKGMYDPSEPCKKCKNEYFNCGSIQVRSSDEAPNFYKICTKCKLDNSNYTSYSKGPKKVKVTKQPVLPTSEPDILVI
jgi:DNA-directed RNA polymerase subunit M/transcription elongation factor TFIIS